MDKNIERYFDDEGLLSVGKHPEIGVDVEQAISGIDWLTKGTSGPRFNDGTLKLYQFRYIPYTNPTPNTPVYYTRPIVASPVIRLTRMGAQATKIVTKKLMDAASDYAKSFYTMYKALELKGKSHKEAIDYIEKDSKLNSILYRVDLDTKREEFDQDALKSLFDELVDFAYECFENSTPVKWSKELYAKVAEVTGVRKGSKGPLVNAGRATVSALSIINLLGNFDSARGSRAKQGEELIKKCVDFFKGDAAMPGEVTDATRSYSAESVVSDKKTVRILHVTDWEKFTEFLNELHASEADDMKSYGM